MSSSIKPYAQQIGGTLPKLWPGIETRVLRGAYGYENPTPVIEELRDTRKEFCSSVGTAVKDGVLAASITAKVAKGVIGATSRISGRIMNGRSPANAVEIEWYNTPLAFPVGKLIEKRSASSQEKRAALNDCLLTVLPFVTDVVESYDSNKKRLMKAAVHIGLGLQAGNAPRQVVKQELRDAALKTPAGKFVRVTAPRALSATLVAHNRVSHAMNGLPKAPQTPSIESIVPKSKL